MTFVLLTIAALNLSLPEEKCVKQEVEKLQGTWLFQTLEINGQQIPSEALKGSKIIMKGDQFESLASGSTYTGTLKIDPTKKPKTIDLVFTGGPEKGNTTLGIYELDGDTLKICLTLMGKERPKEFSTKAVSGLALETLKREKTP